MKHILKGELSLGGWEEVKKVPGQVSLSPYGRNGATVKGSRPLLFGLSEWVRLEELVLWITSQELCLRKAQGLVGLPPHHLPSRQLLALSSLKVAKAAVL